MIKKVIKQIIYYKKIVHCLLFLLNKLNELIILILSSMCVCMPVELFLEPPTCITTLNFGLYQICLYGGRGYVNYTHTHTHTQMVFQKN